VFQLGTVDVRLSRTRTGLSRRRPFSGRLRAANIYLFCAGVSMPTLCDKPPKSAYDQELT
jgi:hypothetical protein